MLVSDPETWSREDAGVQAMEIKDAGFFSRGKIILPPRPDLTVDTVLQDLSEFAKAKSYEAYKTALIGSDLVVKRSGWTGIALKIKHSAKDTVILFNPFAPSAFVRLLAMGLIPILVLYFTSWKELLGEFKTFASQSPLLNR